MPNTHRDEFPSHGGAPGAYRGRGVIAAFIVAACLAGAAVPAGAKDGFMDDYFRAKNLDATLVICSLKTKTEYAHNERRAGKRYPCASTFKIPNSLIALRAGAVRDENEIIRWDGKKRDFPAWNADQSMKTAFAASCVWFYRELARRVGMKAYRAALKELGYGNMKTGPAVDAFWLDGSLRISAREQVAFLKAFYGEEFLFEKRHYAMVKRIMRAESGPGYSILAKTGSYQGPAGPTGWYVGYVETPNDVWFFALNFTVRDASQLALRKEAVREALVRLGIVR